MDSPVPLDAIEEAAWRAFIRVALTLPKVLEDDLARGGGLSMSEYIVLMNLSEAPARELRMAELAQQAHLSASRITRVIDDLGTLGFVTKTKSADDGRGFVAALTKTGLRQLRAAYPAHLASVRARFIDRLTPAEVKTLGQALRRLGDEPERPAQ